MKFKDSPSFVPASKDPRQSRQLHPLPKRLVELYGLIAVLMVLIPEWMAEGLNFDFEASTTQLPMRARAWQTLPELRLASMNISELRQLAKEQSLWGYSCDSRDRLSQRLLKRMLRRRKLQRTIQLAEELDGL